jgi:hypothetical protein
MSLFDELKRYNVIRTGIAYLALSWLLIQVAETLLPVYGYSDAVIRNLVAILIAGLVPVVIISVVIGIVNDIEFEITLPPGVTVEKN